MKKTLLAALIPAAFALSSTTAIAGNDYIDLDDVKDWNMVSLETCLDAVLDVIPGEARKVELKIEDHFPVYQFDVDGKDGNPYNVECNAEKGLVTEIEREVTANDPTFKKLAKITEAEAREIALMYHQGTIGSVEREISYDGTVTYEFDIHTTIGHEVKVDVDAVTGEIEESNIEIYEIGMEGE